MTTNKPEAKRYTPAHSVDSVMRGHLFMEECERGAWVSLEDYEALQAERDSLRKDAERYQWLRSHDRVSDKHEDGMGPPGTVGEVFISQGDGYAVAEEGDDLDAAIDAAMRRDNP